MQRLAFWLDYVTAYHPGDRVNSGKGSEQQFPTLSTRFNVLRILTSPIKGNPLFCFEEYTMNAILFLTFIMKWWMGRAVLNDSTLTKSIGNFGYSL